jgi:hypothetical protein
MNRKVIVFLIVSMSLLTSAGYLVSRLMGPMTSMSRPGPYRVPEDDPGFQEMMKGEAEWRKHCRPYHETELNAYIVRLYDQANCPQPPSNRIEILESGKPIYTLTGHVTLGYPLAQNQPPDSEKIVVGMDITGENIPELLISESSRDVYSHCCYTFHLFRLGQQFSSIQDIPLLDDDEAAFVRRPGVKGLVLAATDYSAFTNFPKDFTGSPAGRVFLSFQDGKFRLDARLMKSNAPTDTEIAKCATLFKPSRAWKGQANAGQPLGMWYYATDLIYTGNETQAWVFLDAAWGGSATDKKRYLDEYQARLKKSMYYQDLESLQKAPVSDTDQKIDWTKQCFAYVRG